MPVAFTLPEQLKVVEGLPPTVGAAAPLESDYVSVKNLHKLFAIIHYHQGDADNQRWNVMEATSVAGAGAQAIVNAVPIWSNLDCEASDTLVERTAAVNYSSGVTTPKHKLIVFQIDPSALSAGFDCVNIVTNGNVAATSYAEILFIGVPRYAGPVASQPSIIVD